MVFSEGCNFCEFRVLEKIIHRKQKFYMVHTLFLTDSRKFNPTKYTTYTVYIKRSYSFHVQFIFIDSETTHRRCLVLKKFQDTASLICREMPQKNDWLGKVFTLLSSLFRCFSGTTIHITLSTTTEPYFVSINSNLSFTHLVNTCFLIVMVSPHLCMGKS